MNDSLRFPIGKFDPDFEFDNNLRQSFIGTIAALPDTITNAVKGLDDIQLDTPYRTDGWTVRQVVHHLADSHMNSYCRFKLALTEDVPTIRAYYEDRWAELPDNDLPVEHSLNILDGVHAHWSALLRAMKEDDFERKLIHPESGEWKLGRFLGLYDWHSKHHTAHITELRNRSGW